jgi:hypothetical protein
LPFIKGEEEISTFIFVRFLIVFSLLVFEVVFTKLVLFFGQNTSIGPLSFTFVSDRSFKFFKYQISPLSFLNIR